MYRAVRVPVIRNGKVRARRSDVRSTRLDSRCPAIIAPSNNVMKVVVALSKTAGETDVLNNSWVSIQLFRNSHIKSGTGYPVRRFSAATTAASPVPGYGVSPLAVSASERRNPSWERNRHKRSPHRRVRGLCRMCPRLDIGARGPGRVVVVVTLSA